MENTHKFTPVHSEGIPSSNSIKQATYVVQGRQRWAYSNSTRVTQLLSIEQLAEGLTSLIDAITTDTHDALKRCVLQGLHQAYVGAIIAPVTTYQITTTITRTKMGFAVNLLVLLESGAEFINSQAFIIAA